MNKTIYDTINETLYTHTLSNSLTVYMLPKPGFHKTYVTLSTPLGSNITTYHKDGKTNSIPYGVAHFLEHKLFEQEGKDVSELFALNGAQVNAYTMNNRTTYLFSCTDHVLPNIKLLLQFVFHPTFTQEGIETEIGIINQEISMYEDDPNTAIYMGVLRNMYHNHPVQYDILGTTSSIATINKTILDDVHQLFYHPENMVLFITGNIDIENTIQFLEDHIKEPSLSTAPINQDSFTEPLVVKTHSDSKEMDVIIPNCLIGLKLSVEKLPYSNIMKSELIYTILLDVLIGKSTTNYETLLSKGYINDSFGMDVTIESDYGYVLIGGNTKYPTEFTEAIQLMILEASSKAVDQEDFNRTKKQIIGSFIQALNSLEYIANQFTKYHFMNTSLFDVLDVASTITIEDIEQAFKTLNSPDQFASYTIYPKTK